MEAKQSKAIQKKSSGNEKVILGKKNQSQKKKKKHKRKTEGGGKDAGKSSTSPEMDVVQDDQADVEADVSTKIVADVSTKIVKQKPIHIRQTATKYSEAIATLKQSHRKQIAASIKPQVKVQHTSQTNVVQPLLTSLSSNQTTKKALNTSAILGTFTHPNTLRWENELSDPKSEEERLHLYKLNRRKRYVAEASMDYPEWLASGVTGNGEGTLQEHMNSKPHQEPPTRKPPASRPHTQDRLLEQVISKPRSQHLVTGIGQMSPFKTHNQDIMVNC